MASDRNWDVIGRTDRRSLPFNITINTADASGNGVEIVPAQAGTIPYVMGYMFTNEAVGALNMHLSHTAAAAGATQITAERFLIAATGIDQAEFSVPLAGVLSQNIGIVASGAGQVATQVWGYYL